LSSRTDWDAGGNRIIKSYIMFHKQHNSMWDHTMTAVAH